MSTEIKAAVKQQFSAAAAHYVTSAIHAQGADLPRLAELAGLTGAELVLDVATAAGHTALALAPGAKHVTGMDLTAEMLVEARRLAAERGVANISFTEGDAERIPFPDNYFHVVTCRIAAHHFPNVAAFCGEVRRVLVPGGRLLLVDNVAPEEDDLDQFINRIDKLRDPSHVRAHKLSEWLRFLGAAGLTGTVDRIFTTKIELDVWMERMGVQADVAAQVRGLLNGAPERFKETFAITEKGFQLYKAIIVAQKDGAPEAGASSRAQFGRRAALYTTSQGHAEGADLKMLVERLGLTGREKVLDVATGTGHTALALAPHAAHVTGLDITPAMLEEARTLAAARGLADRTDWVEGDVHRLPFPDGAFDVVTVRRAPHHFADARAALAEMRRVVRPDGLLGFVDQVSPEEPAGRELLETMEKLRDPSHVRAHSPEQWAGIFRETGWQVLWAEVQREHRSFAEWLDLAYATGPVRDAVLQVMDAAPPEALAALEHRQGPDGERSFRRDRLVAICRSG